MASDVKNSAIVTTMVRQVVPENLLGYVERLAEESSYNTDKAKTYRTIQFSHKGLVKTLEYANELAEVAKMDAEMEESVDKELREEVMPHLERMSQEICHGLLLADKEEALTGYDEDDATLEVRAGAGGQEAGIFAHEVFQLYCRYAQYLGFDVEVTERQEFNPTASSGKEVTTTGVRSAVAAVSGAGVFRALKYECGVHRVQRVPVTGTHSDRLQTSTCSVAVVPLSRRVEIDVPKKDLKYESMRSSGAGGQNVNKVNSACRLTHLPTGTVVTCEEERSLLQNEAKALLKLKQELYRRKFEEQITRQNNSRKFQVKRTQVITCKAFCWYMYGTFCY